ncbi:hypothetical protein A6M27_02775 [Acidithiobacillus thiooxidans]|uniref:MobA/VirD2-like nuclease domain-containing protein n=1 Tax=Acidithiobacillus thiooxidans TaxID=930 RepID=A0A1C2IRB5_ACITH|nr:DUF3363 domain-containing protein [Acidithiobacillus thiooxidans]OCX72291.1 hypothetical protein A6O24_14215 [Acidithiobacillus thiooxidans]OCX76256.1 hypothetical protein A6P07_02875 [Acidithiobacillus thiooxidans]OCX78492.1 hypothetical protein A6O26_18085 [Acidithiobacillus thiooxidans]OCX89273.1 hypothetical protein A6M27_02775 [Acidithiobacillus thiooxidans]
MPTVKSDTSVSGKSFKARKEFDDEKQLGRPRASKVFNAVQRAKGANGAPKKKAFSKPKISRSRPRLPFPRGPSLKSAARRCMVKVNYVTNKKAGQWAAHGQYLQREGAQKDDEQGLGFDAQTDDVSMPTMMHQWQLDGDERLFKIVLSPEDGDRVHLQHFTREFMQGMEDHLGKPLEWAAVDHYNTAHPHVHVVLRGKDNLQISPDLIRNGLRKMAEEQITARLGYKSPGEVLHSREKEIEARQFTRLDKDIQHRLQTVPAISQDRLFITEHPLKPAAGKRVHQSDYVSQRLRLRRLDTLEKLGIAEKVGPTTWAFEEGWEKALKDLQVLQQRTTMINQGRALMTDPRCPPVVTKIQAGDHLVGRVLGTGMDEQYDRSFILIEGTDSRVHIVYQNNAIEKQRAEQKLQPRTLVAISGKSFEKDGKTISYSKVLEYDLSIPDQHFKSAKIPEQALDDALDAGQQPSDKAVTGFQAVWHQQLRDRQLQRERERSQKQQKSRDSRGKSGQDLA